MTDHSKLKAKAEIDEMCNERFTNISPGDLLELIAEITALRIGLADAKYRIEQGRIWNGMGWTLTGLNSYGQQQALDAIDLALSKEG